MLVNRKKRYAFIHIPKTAGESITSALVADGAEFLLRKHSTYMDAELNWDEDIDRYFTFSVVRNPWDQVVSLYEHLRKPAYVDHGLLRQQYADFEGLLNPRPASKMAIEMSFRDWCLAIYSQKQYPHLFFSEQIDFLRGCSGELMVTRTIRFEDLKDELSRLFTSLNISTATPHLNPSSRGAYQDYYDDETRALIARAYAKTISKFSFAF